MDPVLATRLLGLAQSAFAWAMLGLALFIAAAIALDSPCLEWRGRPAAMRVSRRAAKLGYVLAMVLGALCVVLAVAGSGQGLGA